MSTAAAAEDIEGLMASPSEPLLTPTTSKGSVQGGSAPGSPVKKKPVVVAQARPTWFQKYSFLLYAALLLVSATGNSVFFKKMINKFPNYPYFLSQLTTFVYIPIFWSVVLYEIKFTNFITPAMYKFPKWKFFVMGALDATAGVFMLFGGVHTSGSFQALLLQTVIPITMVLSYLILKERYKPLQYVGAGIIVLGVSFVLVPQVLNKSKSGGTGNILIFNIIFLLSNIPSALSNVYKEFAFTEEMDINLLQAWVANWQLLFGLMLSPLNSLKFLGDSYLSLHDLPNAIVNGGKCLVGINTLLTNCIPIDQPQIAGIAQCDDCSGGWIMVLFYLFFNLSYNVAIVLVIKYAGANILNFVMTLRLPLVQLAFAISLFNNPPDKFKWPSIVGLMIILCGLVVYRFGSSRKAEEKPQGEEEEAVMMFAGMEPAQIPVWVKTHTQQRADPHRIRSGLYARLGVIESPRTNSASSKRRLERSASGPRKP